MSTDRRARLRPRDGARGLYYGGGYGSAGGSSSFRRNLLSRSLGDGVLPWLATRPGSTQAPNSPNSPLQSIGSFTDSFNLAIDSVSDQISSIGTGISSGFNNLFNSLGFVDSSTAGNAVGQPSSRSIALTPIGNILEPLAQTDGLVFPYTPTIDYVQAVDYSSYDVTHSNQEMFSYTRSKAPTIGISGKFTIQNSFEASYALAALHFCRVMSKMSFGQSANAGTPPPVILFSAYGQYVFGDIPVIITGFNISYPEDVDYVRVANTDSFLPSKFSIQLSLTVQNTPQTLRSFNLEQFRKGTLLQKGGWT